MNNSNNPNNPRINLVFLLEEPSAKDFLCALLPKILPPDVDYRCIPHQGRGNLRKSIPIKLRGWRTPNTRFIIVHDQDSNDCKKLKRDLRELCRETPHPDCLIRIVCRELEAWYFGDLDAVQSAFPSFRAARHQNRAKYRQPDDIVNPSKELETIVNGFSKYRAAKKIPQYMNIDANHSQSFRCFVSGVCAHIDSQSP